jgi:hypothetical protein
VDSGEVRLDHGWESTVQDSCLPELYEFAYDAQEYINSPPDGKGINGGGCPVDTGLLRENSFVTVDESTASVLAGANTAAVHYAKYVILGTSMKHANEYLERSYGYALDRLRARNGEL